MPPVTEPDNRNPCPYWRSISRTVDTRSSNPAQMYSHETIIVQWVTNTKMLYLGNQSTNLRKGQWAMGWKAWTGWMTSY